FYQEFLSFYQRELKSSQFLRRSFLLTQLRDSFKESAQNLLFYHYKNKNQKNIEAIYELCPDVFA
ncbi:MAG: hypothetical protein CMK59_08770, partial [Proteobacteria bacterium]|nr:hypothetical protein [Pseudomonadota bacterium]